MAKVELETINVGDILVVLPGRYQKIPEGSMVRVSTSHPIYKTDSWGHSTKNISHYSIGIAPSYGYDGLKSINFRKATSEEISAYHGGKRNINQMAQQQLENDAPCFVQEIEENVTSNGTNTEVKHIGDPKYFETGRAAKNFILDKIQDALQDRKYPKYAIFRYHQTAQAKKPELEFETTKF